MIGADQILMGGYGLCAEGLADARTYIKDFDGGDHLDCYSDIFAPPPDVAGEPRGHTA